MVTKYHFYHAWQFYLKNAPIIIEKSLKMYEQTLENLVMAVERLMHRSATSD